MEWEGVLEDGGVGVEGNLESVGLEGRGGWDGVGELSEGAWDAGSEGSSELKSSSSLTLEKDDRDGTSWGSWSPDQIERSSSWNLLVLSWGSHDSEATGLGKS